MRSESLLQERQSAREKIQLPLGHTLVQHRIEITFDNLHRALSAAPDASDERINEIAQAAGFLSGHLDALRKPFARE